MASRRILVDPRPVESIRYPKRRILESEAIDDPRALAARIDGAGGRDSERTEDSFVRAAMRAAVPGARVLDVGTGLASIPVKLVRRRPDLSIVGLDLSPAIVTAARDRVRRAGLHRTVHVRKARGRRIPFRRGSFDLVISDSFLHHLPDPVPILDEMARVLAPGGRILIRDFRRPGPSRIEAIIRRHGRRLPPEPFRLFADSVRAAFKISEIREMVSESRLAGCRTRRRPGIYLVVEGTPRRRARRR